MQTSELEKKNNKLSGDEECINFRPSPNFKHMKKYLKSKFEESNSSPNQSSDRSTTPNSEEQETVKQPQASSSSSSSSSMAQRVQPPLPPNSPPLELVVPKQEVEDEEYNDGTTTKKEMKTEKEEVAENTPEKIMCRQFARGMCTRGATCIYAHELILSQLPGVYTFCKNFQNSICTYPKCKFVHASVFEKEHFYRTGYLPPHALVHLKESNSPLGPPAALEGTPAEAKPVFSNPPPAMHPGVSSLPTSGNVPADGRTNTDTFGPAASTVKSPNKREWSDLKSPKKREWSDLDTALAAHEIDSNEPLAKKCNSCEVNELRMQCAKAKFEKLMEASEKIRQQKIQLVKSDAKLNNVFDILASKLPTSTANGLLNSGISIRNEKENMQSAMSDQMNLFFRNRMTDSSPSAKLLLTQLLKVMKEPIGDNRGASIPRQ